MSNVGCSRRGYGLTSISPSRLLVAFNTELGPPRPWAASSHIGRNCTMSEWKVFYRDDLDHDRISPSVSRAHGVLHRGAAARVRTPDDGPAEQADRLRDRRGGGDRQSSCQRGAAQA